MVTCYCLIFMFPENPSLVRLGVEVFFGVNIINLGITDTK